MASRRFGRSGWRPIIVSPFDPATIYAGYQYVYRSRDRGDTWERISSDLTDNNPRQMGVNPSAIPYQTITQIAESPLAKGLIYAGTDDGNLHVTRDDGRTWTSIGRNLPLALRKWVSRIVPSKYDEGTVYVAQRGREDDDFAPYLWKSADYGMTWTSIVGNIPSGLDERDSRGSGGEGACSTAATTSASTCRRTAGDAGRCLAPTCRRWRCRTCRFTRAII